ncbi:MAG: hypothetical protein KGN35_11275, partial [Betaproteobacteria bacterium]|nr:hypothetical protein [Betaproteobacteria bacterium]
MKNITAIARLFKHGDRYFTIIHETNAMIDLVTEYVEKIAKTAWETPLDVAQHPRPLEQLVCMKKARLDPFLFVDNSVILLICRWLGMICNSKDGLRTLAHP